MDRARREGKREGKLPDYSPGDSPRSPGSPAHMQIGSGLQMLSHLEDIKENAVVRAPDDEVQFMPFEVIHEYEDDDDSKHRVDEIKYDMNDEPVLPPRLRPRKEAREKRRHSQQPRRNSAYRERSV